MLNLQYIWVNKMVVKFIKKRTLEIERQFLELPFEDCRKKANTMTLLQSIAGSGQLMAVIVIPAEQPQRWLLIDGYARVRAITKLGQDTVMAEIWECSLSDALLLLLADKKNEHFSIMEEAFLLQTLYQRGLTIVEIATNIGRNHSWVSRRLSILELPLMLQSAMLSGEISPWIAQRVLLPVARATPEDCQKFLEHIKKNPYSTRQIKSFFEHYKQVSKPIRANMIATPDVFFKVQAEQHSMDKATEECISVEMEWKKGIVLCRRALKKLISFVPMLFTAQQPLALRKELFRQLEGLFEDVKALEKQIVGGSHDITSDQR